jgi:hypothetical protein
MATTTNYSWVTPDDTSLVKDGAAAIRSLGTSVDTTTKALNPSTTLGDIEYRSSTANTNTRLGIGSTGQVLTVAGGVPTWAASAGGGKVLQVVAATYSTETQSTSNSYADTGLTATITPSSATSKVLVIMTQNGVAKNGDTNVGLRLVRNSTTIAQIGVLLLSTSTSLYQEGNGNIAFLDSPATTSATTYKTTFNSAAGISFTRVQNNSSVSSIILMEIGE